MNETLKRISELAPELVTERRGLYFWTISLAVHKPIDYSRQFIIDWLVGKGCEVDCRFTDTERVVDCMLGSGLTAIYPRGIWLSPDPDEINAESETHALLLCVLAVLQSEESAGKPSGNGSQGSVEGSTPLASNQKEDDRATKGDETE